jgi:hypothetical protein
MLNLTEATPGLSFGSVIFRSDLYSVESIKETWQKKFGASFFLESQFNPSLEYYQKEMGTPLARFLILSSSTISRDSLLESKKWALSEEEKSVGANGERLINWDTGLLTSESFFLATTKSYAHRFYLGEKLFCELTLYMEQGKWLSLPWTYPDYLHSQKLEFLSWGRSFLLEKLLQKAQSLL